MTPEKFADKMNAIFNEYFNDEERRHIAMDNLMCEVLRELGYGDGIDIFENADKWYA